MTGRMRIEFGLPFVNFLYEKLYFYLLFVLFIGCDNFHNKRSEQSGNGKFSFDYAVVIIDNCQYIQYHVYMGEAVTHKGDCTNKIHGFNVER